MWATLGLGSDAIFLKCLRREQKSPRDANISNPGLPHSVLGRLGADTHVDCGFGKSRGVFRNLWGSRPRRTASGLLALGPGPGDIFFKSGSRNQLAPVQYDVCEASPNHGAANRSGVYIENGCSFWHRVIIGLWNFLVSHDAIITHTTGR